MIRPPGFSLAFYPVSEYNRAYVHTQSDIDLAVESLAPEKHFPALATIGD